MTVTGGYRESCGVMFSSWELPSCGNAGNSNGSKYIQLCGAATWSTRATPVPSCKCGVQERSRSQSKAKYSEHPSYEYFLLLTLWETANAELMIELFITSCHDVIFLFLPLLLVHLEPATVLFVLYAVLSKLTCLCCVIVTTLHRLSFLIYKFSGSEVCLAKELKKREVAGIHSSPTSLWCDTNHIGNSACNNSSLPWEPGYQAISLQW